MNVLFLDIDGPLAFGKCFFQDRFYITKDLRKISSIIKHELDTGEKIDINESVKMPYGWHQKSCDALAALIRDLDLKIVISSDWRRHYTVKEISQMFEFYKIPHDCIIGMTEIIYWGGGLERARLAEIDSWVIGWKNENPEEEIKWVTVDDMNLSALGKEHYVYTNTGISAPGVADKIRKNINSQ